MPDYEPGSSRPGTGDARQEAAEVLRRVLTAVESGELEATSGQAKALLRRIEGAVIGLETDERDSGDAEP